MVKEKSTYEELETRLNQVEAENEKLRTQLTQTNNEFHRYKSLLLNLQMGVLVENADRKIIETNPAFCDLFGISSPTMVKGMNCEKAAQNAANLFIDPEGFIEQINEILSRNQIVLNQELELKDGRIFERDFLPVFQENEFIGNMWLYRDISKLKEKERKLTEINAAKDKLFSIITHDLRNPGNAILSLSEMIVKNIRDKNYDELEIQGEYLRQSAKQSVDLINNLTHWSRLQSGRIEYKPEKINIKNLVDNMLDLSKVSLYEKEITLQTEIKPDLEVEGDPFMLELVIRNLISNAIKYTPSEGEITIKAFQLAEATKISISDTGLGIKKEDLNNLFTIEKKSKRPGTNNEKGTGLGLILCQEFTELHGGTIHVDSKEGQGSTFTVTLPV